IRRARLRPSLRSPCITPPRLNGASAGSRRHEEVRIWQFGRGIRQERIDDREARIGLDAAYRVKRLRAQPEKNGGFGNLPEYDRHIRRLRSPEQYQVAAR